MSNPVDSSNNPNEPEAQGTGGVRPQTSNNGTESRSQNFVMRSVRRTTPRSRTDTVSRRNKIRVRFQRRVLSLSNEQKKSLLSAIAKALKIDESPTETPNRVDEDRLSYRIELNDDNARTPTNTPTNISSQSNVIVENRDESDAESNVTVENENDSDAESNATVADNGRPQDSLLNMFNRTASNIFNNLFTRNQPSDDNSE